MRIILDACCMERKSLAHAYLKGKLNFPEYYGNNLDALFDCLTELAAVEIAIINKDRAGAYFHKVYQVFLKAMEENPLLVLSDWEEEPGHK